MINDKTMLRQMERIRKAYDLSMEQFNNGVDPCDSLPEEIKNLPGVKYFRDKNPNKLLNSGSPDIRKYLDPRPGMRFLDAPCCANLASYRLDKWPSVYYGVDISPKLIRAMKGFARKENISIGGLWEADLSNLPFKDDFFDIAAIIGVFEYCTLEYIKQALKELRRVLKPGARAVMDFPNLRHPYVEDMSILEEHLDRPNILNSRQDFERDLTPLFSINHVDDARVMIKYFLRSV